MTTKPNDSVSVSLRPSVNDSASARLKSNGGAMKKRPDVKKKSLSAKSRTP